MRFDHVWLRYARRGPWVLRDVELSLPPGRLAVVTGRNGVGKTTLLLAAAGLLRPARGDLLDRPRRVGWVPERFPPGQPFTVRGYLLAMARIRGLSPAVAGPEIDGWLDRLGLAPHVATPLAELSKGTAQKVGLVQALVPRPDLLVLDEPWEGLDAQTRGRIPEIITGLLGAGGSVLVSDHLGEVDGLPDPIRWQVADGAVGDPSPGLRSTSGRHIIEVAVTAPELPAAVARLRGDGHDVVRVRPWE